MKPTGKGNVMQFKNARLIDESIQYKLYEMVKSPNIYQYYIASNKGRIECVGNDIDRMLEILDAICEQEMEMMRGAIMLLED